MITQNQVLDYISTLAFFGVAAIGTYQAELMVAIPPQYNLLALIGFGILNQITADARVKGVLVKGNAQVDELQAQLDAAIDKIHELEQQLDERQAMMMGDGA